MYIYIHVHTAYSTTAIVSPIRWNTGTVINGRLESKKEEAERKSSMSRVRGIKGIADETKLAGNVRPRLL